MLRNCTAKMPSEMTMDKATHVVDMTNTKISIDCYQMYKTIISNDPTTAKTATFQPAK